MSDVIGHVDFSFSPSLSLHGDPEDYHVEVTGKIMATPDEAPDDADPEPAGEIEMLLVRVAAAESDGVSLFQVFDSYDQGLHEVFCALFDKNEEIKTSLPFDSFAHELLVIRNLTLAPRYQNTSLGSQVIETAARFLVTMGLVVAYDDFGLSTDDLKRVGFVKLASEGLLVWDGANKNPPLH